MDCLRIVASLIVFWGHAYAQWHTAVGYNYNGIDWGHVAVVIFFALSGYVISFTATANNRGPLQYAQARLSRLYSVVLPALVITAIIELIVATKAPELILHYTRGLSWPRYFISAFFLNETWFFSASPPINGPLWSLSFEFWYYVIFGLFLFKPKGLKGWTLPILACLIAGPKILVMMPIWIMGNLAYRIKNPIKSNGLSWLWIGVLIVIVYLLVVFLPGMPFRLGTHPLFFAGQFITDNIIGFFIALILWLLPSYTPQKGGNNSKIVGVVRKFADLTFPLYVLHDPLLVLFRSVWKTVYFDNLQMSIGMLFAFAVSMLLGHMMEKNRYRWINAFKKMLSKGKAYYLQTNRQ